MKIGHITVYKLSYGSPLQALATQNVFCRYGMDCELLKYEPDFSKFQKVIENLWLLLKPKKLVEKLGLYGNRMINKYLYKEIYLNRKRREKAFERFVSQYINMTELLPTREARNAEIKKYKVILSGSDQLWNPVNFKEGYFTCEVVPDYIKKISYGSSFGTSIIPKEQKEGTKNYLERFSKISMRESTGAKLVCQLTGNDVPVVLDPTMLLTAEEWEKFSPVIPIIKGKYIFAYFLSDRLEFRLWVKQLKEKTGYKIVSMPHMLRYVKCDKKFADIELYDCTPGDWINVIRNAEYVCTDSYHGTIFSIINHRQFLTMCAYKDEDRNSTNTRIYEILNKLGLTDRLYRKGEKIDKILCDIDYEKVMKILEAHKKKSLEYIRDILEE